MAKDGSIHRAPICDMMPGGYHHRPGNGLILRFKFSGHPKKFVLFIYIFMVSEVHGFNNMLGSYFSQFDLPFIYLLLNKQFKAKCVYTAVHHWHECQMSVPCVSKYDKLIAANEPDF